MICDKYREQTALYVPLLLCTAFSQLSDFNHFTPKTERGSSYEEKYLAEDEISAELLADTLSDVPEDADSDSDSSVIGNGQNKIVHPLPSTTGVFGEYFLKISVHKNSQRICYKFLSKQYKSWFKLLKPRERAF
jgi:hypothetical protein